ncbi:undecaprenyl-diphosphate phosphatase [Algihabitans albus]|uniref:undecaprenyl-diphosphate phosphatase n=1 Tax=Algihabitans albus TaxID=2164067 RepID=UPI000E5D2DB3|nr:undecaprenyl-diphosphate phosphatase [Algihabitans albus]
MPLLLLAILAVVQGITEFLPISSSGHLVLVWEIFDQTEAAGVRAAETERLDLDVAVHVGTLAAVCLYFWRDIWRMAIGLLRLLTGRRDPGARLAGLVLLASLPIIPAGFFGKDLVLIYFRDIAVIGWTTLGFGILLGLADRFGMLINRIEHMGWLQALMIGLAQVLALVPGTSRSGITMTAARFLGFERSEAARFSLLLAIPAIAGAGTLAGLDLYESGDLSLGRDAAIAAGLAFVAALIAIAAMMAWLRHASFAPFVIYRILLGALLLALVYGGVI